jgi:DNA methylase
MPEQVLGRIIRACSNSGEVVLDPFGGSGTTLAVAKRLNRRFLGFELSPDYAAAIQTRLDATKAGQPSDGNSEPQAGGKEQGQRPLKCSSGNYFQKEVVGPAATSTVHGDAVAARMLLQE